MDSGAEHSDGVEITHDVARDDSVCGVFCDAEPGVSFEAFGYTFHRCRDCYEGPCSRCWEPIPENTRGSTREKGWCEDCREEIQLLVGDDERGIKKDEDSEQATLITDGGQSQSTEPRLCTRCGAAIEDGAAYLAWLFHTCMSCASESAPRRWGDTGTARKWRYFPRWHMTRHPDLPASKRERYEATA